jgi:hypothetical protein
MGFWANGRLNNVVAVAIVGFITICGAAYAIDSFLRAVHVA